MFQVQVRREQCIRKEGTARKRQGVLLEPAERRTWNKSQKAVSPERKAGMVPGAVRSRFWQTEWPGPPCGRWTEYLPGVPDSVWWEASYCPGNLAVLQAAVEEALEEDAARALYREMTEYAWQVHWPMVVRQIGWDVLGYAVTPLVFQLQLQGEAYDSFTGRNYEVMRGQAPRLTRLYVDYGCWWYGAWPWACVLWS
jgi:hypothetical protein